MPPLLAELDFAQTKDFCTLLGKNKDTLRLRAF